MSEEIDFCGIKIRLDKAMPANMAIIAPDEILSGQKQIDLGETVKCLVVRLSEAGEK